jgi:hypothetical protein
MEGRRIHHAEKQLIGPGKEEANRSHLSKNNTVIWTALVYNNILTNIQYLLWLNLASADELSAQRW